MALWMNCWLKVLKVTANEGMSKWFEEDTSSRRRTKWDYDCQKAMDELKKFGNDVHYHVSEVYSPPRVTSMAKKMRLVPGMTFDLTVDDPDDGQPWDFNDDGKRAKAKELVRSRKSLLLILSPMCAAFSQLQHINFSKMDRQAVQEMVSHGTKHLEFCMERS